MTRRRRGSSLLRQRVRRCAARGLSAEGAREGAGRASSGRGGGKEETEDACAGWQGVGQPPSSALRLPSPVLLHSAPAALEAPVGSTQQIGRAPAAARPASFLKRRSAGAARARKIDACMQLLRGQSLSLSMRRMHALLLPFFFLSHPLPLPPPPSSHAAHDVPRSPAKSCRLLLCTPRVSASCQGRLSPCLWPSLSPLSYLSHARGFTAAPKKAAFSSCHVQRLAS